MKTIGVLGGLGPQATMDFEARIHAVAQRLLPQRGNSGYPPMIVSYHRTLPILVDDQNRPLVPHQLDPRLLEAAKKLGASADFLVIPSNAPHQFQHELEEASGLKVLSMIDLVINEVRQRGWKYVGVLGFGEPTVYLLPLRHVGIGCETISAELSRQLDQAILAVMEGRAGPKEQSLARIAIERMRLQQIDGTILGCTEIPLLLQEQAEAPDLINPLQLLAEAAVREAVGESA
jgi:aspartate racemase